MPRSETALLSVQTAARWPLIVSVLVGAAFVLISAVMLVAMRRDAAARARENAENLVQAIQQDVLHTVEVLDLSLQAVVEGLADPEVVASPRHLQRRILFDRSATAKNLGALVVFDTRGNVVIDATSTPPRQIQPVTDRDYFMAQQEPGQGLVISRPYRSRLIDSDVIGLSRRVYDHQGSYNGVVLGTIKLSYFTDLFRQMRLGSKGSISILRKDGVTLAHHPSFGSPQEKEFQGTPDIQRMLKAPAGTFIAQSATDGIERMVTFKHVGDRPLLVNMALATDDIFAEWWRKVFLLAVILFVVCAATVALTAVLMRELKRRGLAEEALTAANAELARISTTDSLTGLHNRRRFDEALQLEMQRARRTGWPLSLLILDADRFKQFNDRYGHGEGDKALKSIAECIQTGLRRTTDTGFRIGGEEFAILLPEADLKGAGLVAEAVRHELRRRCIPHPDNTPGIMTVSVGIACTGPTGEAPSSFFSRADAALYHAKENGRDRSCASEWDAQVHRAA